MTYYLLPTPINYGLCYFLKYVCHLLVDIFCNNSIGHLHLVSVLRRYAVHVFRRYRNVWHILGLFLRIRHKRRNLDMLDERLMRKIHLNYSFAGTCADNIC